jgi:uncharacterized small protein (DUF1192 family)
MDKQPSDNMIFRLLGAIRDQLVDQSTQIANLGAQMSTLATSAQIAHLDARISTSSLAFRLDAAQRQAELEDRIQALEVEVEALKAAASK